MSRTYHRKKKERWTGSRVYDHSCANHGACDYCRDNRLIRKLREEERAKFEMKHHD